MINKKDIAQAVVTALAFLLIFIVAIDISTYELPIWWYPIIFVIILFIATAMMLQGWLRQIATTQGWSFVGTILGIISLIYSIWASQPKTVTQQGCCGQPAQTTIIIPDEPVIYAVVGIMLLVSTLALFLIGRK